jgi:MFS family permease
MAVPNAAPIARTLRQIETQLAGSLEDAVRRNMRVEIFSAVLFGVFMAALLFIPAVLTKQGGSPALISVYLSLSYLGHIFNVVGLLFLRKVSAKTFAVACWTLGRFAFVLLAFATGSGMLLALATALWLLEILPNPAYTRILQSVYPLANRGRIMALVRFGMAFTILLATPLVGWGLDQLGYHVVFPLAGLVGVASALVFIKMHVVNDRPDSASIQSSPFAAFKAVSGNRRFLIYLVGVVLFGLAGLSVNPLYPDVQINRLGLSYTDLGLLGLAQSVSWLLGYIVWGRMVDRVGALRCTALTFAIQAIAPFTYAFATTGWMLLPAFIGIGLVSAGADIGLVNSCIELADPERTGEYAAAQSTVIGVRGFVAPFLGVGLLAIGLPQPIVFAVAGGLAIAGAIVVNQVQRMQPTQQAQPIRKTG